MAQDTLNPNAVNLTGSVAEAGASHSNRVSGIIVDDPARSMPIGSNVCLSPVLVTHPEKHPATWLQNWACLDGIMLALTFNDEEENFLEGSAVLIGPGIAMCAWHVIEPRFAAVMAGKEAVTCFGVAPEGVRMWWVRKLTRVPDSDLCILGLELATSFEPGQVLTFSTVTTRLPQVGRIAHNRLPCGRTIFPALTGMS